MEIVKIAKSSTIAQMEYDAETKKMKVSFKKKKDSDGEVSIYEYSDVPEEVWEACKTPIGMSTGQAVRRKIVKGGYPYKRV